MAAKKKVPSDNHVEQPPSRASWFPDETPREPGDPWNPAFLSYDQSAPPFIVDGVNPASNGDLSAEERLDWLTKQHKAMRDGA